MRDQIASEFRKLTTTRSVYAMLAGLVAIVAIGVVAIVTSGGSTDLQAPLEQQAFRHVSLTIAPLFGLLLGLRSFTDEFRFGSIVPTLLATPVRRRVLGAKLVATAGGGVVLSLSAMAITIVVGVPLLVAKGVDVTWSTAALAIVVGRLVAATVLWTAIGVGLGLAVRHQVAAIAGIAGLDPCCRGHLLRPGAGRCEVLPGRGRLRDRRRQPGRPVDAGSGCAAARRVRARCGCDRGGPDAASGHRVGVRGGPGQLGDHATNRLRRRGWGSLPVGRSRARG